MQGEGEEFRTRALKQLDKTTQILPPLAKTYAVNGIPDHSETLRRSLNAVNSSNDFVSMFYIRKDGSGMLEIPGQDIWDAVTPADRNLATLVAIEQAFQGENAISEMFDSVASDEKLFAYAVPVYQNVEVVGALCCSNTLVIFKDIASGQSVMNGNRFIHMVSGKGDFLVRSKNVLIPGQLNNLRESNHLSDEASENIRQACANE